MKQSTSTSPAMPTHRLIRIAGFAVLAMGLISSIVIYVVAATSSGSTDVPDFSADRRFNYELERLGGKFAVYSATLNRWLATLWVGTNLAYTVAALSVLTALVCYWLADFMSYPALEDTPPSSKDSGG